MSLRTQLDAEYEKEPTYKRDLEQATSRSSYAPEVRDIKALLKKLARQAREK